MVKIYGSRILYSKIIAKIHESRTLDPEFCIKKLRSQILDPKIMIQVYRFRAFDQNIRSKNYAKILWIRCQHENLGGIEICKQKIASVNQ